MADRLGLVFYWFGCGIAAISGVIGLIFLWDGASLLMAIFGGLAVVSWLIGRALKFILSGR